MERPHLSREPSVRSLKVRFPQTWLESPNRTHRWCSHKDPIYSICSLLLLLLLLLYFYYYYYYYYVYCFYYYYCYIVSCMIIAYMGSFIGCSIDPCLIHFDSPPDPEQTTTLRFSKQLMADSKEGKATGVPVDLCPVVHRCRLSEWLFAGKIRYSLSKKNLLGGELPTNRQWVTSLVISMGFLWGQCPLITGVN